MLTRVPGPSAGAVDTAVKPLMRPAMLAVVVPTFNERDNVHELVARLDGVLSGIDWEVVFVDDDSTDGTRAALRELAQSDARVRLLHRIGRRGLASAVTEGIQATSATYVAVMDADLQHDERLLPRCSSACTRPIATSSSARAIWKPAASATGTSAAA